MIYFVTNTSNNPTESGGTEEVISRIPLINFGFGIPIRRTTIYNSFTMKGGADDTYINNIKINLGDTYDSSSGISLISVKDTPQNNYSMSMSYDYSQSGDTLLNAPFTGNLDAGDISGFGEDIAYFQVLRYSPEDNYSLPFEVARIIYNENSEMREKDYTISSMSPYFYKIRAVTVKGNYGSITNIRHLALNSYEYDWILCDANTHISIVNSNISSVTNNRKDGIVETIGAQYPIVNRYTNTKYRTFSINGTLATAADFSKDIVNEVFVEYREGLTNNEISQINDLILKKLGHPQHLKNDNNQYYLNSMNNIMVDPYIERKYREKIINLLADGKQKILKSPTLGMLIGKFTNVNLTPNTQLNGYVANFTATFTETGAITEENLRNFINLKEDEIEKIMSTEENK